jgi:hypothetical protein
VVPERVKKWLTSDTWDNIIRWIVALSMVGMLYAIVKVQQTSDCLQNYIQNSSRIAAEDRKVVDDLVSQIAESKTSAQTLAALAAYKAARSRNELLRTGNPVCP